MKKRAAAAVSHAADPRKNKVAVDGVYRARSPDYLMILGSSPKVSTKLHISTPTMAAFYFDEREVIRSATPKSKP